MARRYDALLPLGIRYLKAGREDRIAHHSLAWSLRGRQGADVGVWTTLRSELAQSDSAINVVSSEAFWLEDPVDVRAQLDGIADIRIVLYLRRQDRYLQSLYKQAIASGRKTAFDVWLDDMGRRGDYLSIVRAWANAFGQDAITVRPYDRAGERVDVAEDFFSTIGVAFPPIMIRKTEVHNPSPRLELLQFIRALNLTKSKINHDKFFFSVIKRDPSYMRSADLLGYDECRALMARFDADNSTLIEEFYTDASTPLFPELKPFPPAKIWSLGDPEYLKLTTDVLDVLVRLSAAGEIVPGGREQAPKRKRKP